METFEKIVAALDTDPRAEVNEPAHDDHADGQIADAGNALRFMLAGKARVTLKSLRTGARFTYRISQSKDDGRGYPPVHFVSLLNGPDNESQYAYFGYIKRGVFFHGGAKVKVSRDAPGARAFEWAFRALSQGTLPADLQVWHEGRCGRCGRALTVPESIRTGFGPECAGKVM